eukprot:NODE_6_length_4697_cov_15.134354.p1 GENE.NODE_6_length_4697_cov_15.134354~~NODE_6_length_4697_cov_15.134354.p1  ORF type:complete len:1487 (+),score=268.77 NODE_6_length_4697_cov_15.134354:168-4628(+)
MRWWAFGLTVSLVLELPRQSAASCLLDAVAELDRRNVSINGEEQPVKILMYDWPSAKLMPMIFYILLTEKVGYNAVFTGKTSVGYEGVLALADCTDLSNTESCNPGSPGLHGHVLFELWDDPSIRSVLASILRDVPNRYPVLDNTLGYVGEEQIYIPKSIAETALANYTVFLDWYRSYNPELGFGADRFFANFSDLPTPTSCNDITRLKSPFIDVYAAATGDYESLVDAGNNSTMYNCTNNWVLTKPCRELGGVGCIPYIIYNGWGLDIPLQLAFWHNIPLAIADYDPDDAILLIDEQPILVYSYKPASIYGSTPLVKVAYPSANTVEHQNGIFKTAQGEIELYLLTHALLDDFIPRALAMSISFDLDVLTELVSLAGDATDDAMYNVSCKWLQDNKATWLAWVTAAVTCHKGFGAVAELGYGSLTDEYQGEEFFTDETIREDFGCRVCPAGYWAQWASNGQTYLCSYCTAGRVTSQVARTSCDECAAGRYAEQAGMTSCEACSVGMYAPQTGNSQCANCGQGHSRPNLWATMTAVTVNDEVTYTYLEGARSNTSCGCTIGAQETSEGECVECSTGMECGGMDDINIVYGYASDGYSSTFKCYAYAAACPGGTPGLCADGRDNTSIGCSLCERGKKAEPNGTCSECQSSDAVPVILVTLAVFIFLCFVYWVSSRDRRWPSLPTLLLALTFSQSFTFVQQLAVIGTIEIEWRSPMSAVFNLAKGINFNTEFLHPSCVSSMTPLGTYTVRVLLLALVGIVVMLVHAFVVMVFHGSTFRKRAPALYCCLGTLLNTFFVSVVSTMLAPLHCVKHPNGRSTVSEYPTVLCDEGGDQVYMVIVGTVSLALPVAFLAFASWAIYVFPSKMMQGDARFLQTWGFFFLRHKAHVYWYGTPLLIRNSLITIAPIFSSTFIQISLVQIIFTGSIIATSFYQPWRSTRANLLDVFCHIVVILVLNMSTYYADVENYSAIAYLCTILILTLAAVVVVMILICFHKLCMARITSSAKTFEYFICHHKAGAGAFARLLKTNLLRSSRVKSQVFIDSDDLSDLDQLFDCVAYHTAVLVVLRTEQILSRPWCVGEITTAHQHGVTVVPVVFDGLPALPHNFIKEYEIYVPDLSCLHKRHITLEMIKDALDWLEGLPHITLPHFVTQHTLDNLVERLVDAKVKGHCSDTIAMDPGATLPSDVCTVIIYDYSRYEATATALILHDFVTPYASTDLKLVPHLLPWGMRLPRTVEFVILVCTEGVFNQPDVLKALADAQRSNRVKVLPILGDEAFRFPTPDSLSQLRPLIAELDLDSSSKAEAQKSTKTHSKLARRVRTVGKAVEKEVEREADPADSMTSFIDSIFHVIAVVFQPVHYSANERTLSTKAQEVVARLRKWTEAADLSDTRPFVFTATSTLVEYARKKCNRTFTDAGNVPRCVSPLENGCISENSSLDNDNVEGPVVNASTDDAGKNPVSSEAEAPPLMGSTATIYADGAEVGEVEYCV